MMRVLKKLVPVLFLFLMIALNGKGQEENKNGDVYFIVEEMPVYPGGEEQIGKDIANSVEYPKVAKEQGIEGKVYITFVVNKKGNISTTKVERGVDPSLDKEALRVVNALDKVWKPGKQSGEVVKVSFTIPINFALDGNKSSQTNTMPSKKNGDVYFIVEKMPEFPGGDIALRNFIAENIEYPESAKKEGIEGKVYVSFIVDVDGSVSTVNVERGVDPLLDKESIRVVSKLPTWKPGIENGKAVKVQYTVPINFALS